MREGRDRQFAFILWPGPFITHTGHLETSATWRSMAQAGLYAVFFCMLGEYTAKSEAQLLTRKIPEAGTTWDISFGNRVGSRTRVQEGYPGFDVGEKIWCVCVFFFFYWWWLVLWGRHKACAEHTGVRSRTHSRMKEWGGSFFFPAYFAWKFTFSICDKLSYSFESKKIY